MDHAEVCNHYSVIQHEDLRGQNQGHESSYAAEKKEKKNESLGLVPTWPDSVGYVGKNPTTNENVKKGPLFTMF